MFGMGTGVSPPLQSPENHNAIRQSVLDKALVKFARIPNRVNFMVKPHD